MGVVRCALTQPKETDDWKREATKEKGLNIISSRQFEKEANKESVMFIVVAKDFSLDPQEEPP
jgi:hypothetical protein